MSDIIRVERFEYSEQSTIGKLYINGEYFCYTLEDTVRPWGIKVKKHTAIPGGSIEQPKRYKVTISYSTRFNRDMIMIYTEDDKVTLKENGISFKGIRAHGGNTHHNTEGCPLVAKNHLSDEKIQGTMEKPLTALVVEMLKTCDVQWEVINLPQSN